MDDFMRNLSTTDTKKKIALGEEIIDFLENVENDITCEDIGGFIDGLVPWMQSSNFKVSQNGLDIVSLLVDRLGSSFRPYMNTVLNPVCDRMGDSRESVRERANVVISLLMKKVMEPQPLLEKLMPVFSHKNGKVREEMLYLFQNTLNSYGSQSLIVSRFLPSITSLLSDPGAPVRDAAQSTLVEIYKHFGERVRADLQKKYTIPHAKLNQLMAKFDDARSSGDLLPTAMGNATEGEDLTSINDTSLGFGRSLDDYYSSLDYFDDYCILGGRGGEDETDRLSQKSSGSAKSRSSSVPAHARKANSAFAMPRPPTTESSSGRPPTLVKRNHSMRMSSTGSTGGAQAGAVDEESFISAFEEVKRVTIFSGRGLSDELNKIKETLSKSSNDWKVRIEALQMLRSLLIAGAANHEEFFYALRTFDVPFQVSVKDLRSQVVREACITIAYFSQQLQNKVDRFLETLLQALINLIPNSAKVMSTSGIVCVRFIIQNTNSSRLIPILVSNISSKSREIRKHCCEFLDQLLHTWPTHSLEKHVVILGDAIKKGIADADPDARQFARKAFWGYADHFKEQSDHLLNSLDGTYRRLLQAGEMSNSSSNNSLNTMTNTHRTLPKSRQVTGSNENLQHHVRRGVTPTNSGTMTIGRKSSGGSGIPMYTSPLKSNAPFNGYQRSPSGYGGTPSPSAVSPGMSARSNSAIDPSAVRRASVRAQYAQRHRIQVANQAGRPRKSSMGGPEGASPVPGSSGGPPQGQRSRSRIGGITHSQPGSRSTSPSSLRSYHTYNYDGSPMGSAPFGTRRRSAPRSTNSSREQSPNRIQSHYGPKFYNRSNSSSSSAAGKPPKSPMITENFLKQNQEAESALADALNKGNRSRRSVGGGGSGPFDDGASDDGSEASSISSTGNNLRNNGPTPMKQRYLQQSPNTPTSSGSLRFGVGGRRTTPTSSSSIGKYGNVRRGQSDLADDSENLNPEDVHKSLRSTANAIQNYSFDSPGADFNDSPMMFDNSKGRNGTNSYITSLDEKMSLMDISSPGLIGRSSMERIITPEKNGESKGDNLGAVQEIMTILQTVKDQSQTTERRNCMTRLIRMIRDGKTIVIQENFRAILRLLLENLSDEVGATRALVFGVLTEMLKQHSLIASFQAFTELIILKVLEAHKDDEKDVERAAEGCASSMAGVLPPDVVLRVLNPIIKTGDFPVNQAAIKMLTKVADHPENKEIILNNLEDVMPGLLKAYDNVESSVRKASVFCMVALHQLVGEELQPHLESLNGSKLKLLNLYIKRAQAQKEQSAPVSPRQLATPL